MPLSEPRKPLAVEVRDLWVTLEHNDVLQSVNVEIPDGLFVGIVGPNGGGKTTFLRTLVGLQPPTRGVVRLLGDAPTSRVARQAMAYVPQNASHVDARFPATAREVVQLGRLGHGRPWR
jgi:zinc transport system ATP-binding protein